MQKRRRTGSHMANLIFKKSWDLQYYSSVIDVQIEISKLDTLLTIRYVLRSSIPKKIAQICHTSVHVTVWAKFSFSNHRELKITFLVCKFAIFSFHIKEQSPIRKLVIKIFTFFCMDKTAFDMDKIVFDLVTAKKLRFF